MGSLKFIDVDDDVDANVGGGGGFPSLEEIDFSCMPNLEGWSSSLSLSSLSLSSQATQVAVLPRLKKVRLFKCPNLTGGIPLACSPVESVDMLDCNGMFLGSLRNLTALETLLIRYCDNLKSLPVELKSLAKLTRLKIYKCSNLVSLVEGGLKSLSSLKTLEIVRCDALERLPELGKTSLVNLRIKGCGEMKFLKEDFEQLVALETLTLSDLPKLTCLPEGIKDSAATLKRLEIGGYEEDNDAMDLPDWIGTCLIKLEYLEINAPKNWKVLPLWMQHLAALETLRVCRCNKELKKRWKRWKEKTRFGSEEDDEEDEEYNEDDEEDEEWDSEEYNEDDEEDDEDDEEDEEYNEDDEEDEEWDSEEYNEDDEEDEEYNEDNKEDEDKEREDYCFNMISHVPDVKLVRYKYELDWQEPKQPPLSS